LKWGKRISHLLLLFLLCVLIFYTGIYLQIDIPEGELSMKIHSMLLESSGQTYLAGVFYQEKNQISGGKWLVSHAMKLIPVGIYMCEMESREKTEQEDCETYDLILEKQANDENEVGEDGKLLDEKKSNVPKEVSARKISLEKLKDFEYLVSNFYTIDASTSITENQLNVESLLKKDMTLNDIENGPKILIYHTHSQEAFADSKKGDNSETIMGIGAYLAEILNKEYNIETLHHKGIYDLVDGKLDRSKAYQLAETEVRKILKDNPGIEVVIDLHRDGVKESTHLVTEIDGKKTAQIMFFNGLSRTRTNGDIEYLHNPYIEDNLAFSLQMQIEAMEKYPGFVRRIYLKSYRYNMHLMPKMLLVEAGAQTNTVAEMKCAMEVLAEILDGVLTK